MLVLALEVVSVEKDPLKELADRARRIEELKRKIESLVESLSKSYTGSERLSKLIENLLKTQAPPPPPPKNKLSDAALELGEYEYQLKRYLEHLTEHAEILRRLSELEGMVTSRLEEVKKWAEKMENINPYYASQARRVVSKAKRVLDELPLASPKESLERLNETYGNMARVVRMCQSIYAGKLKELEGLVGSARKILGKARSVARLEEADVIMRAKKVLEEAEARLSEARARAPYDSLDVVELRRKLEEIHKQLRNLVLSSLTEEETSLLEEYGRLAKAYKGKYAPYHLLLEQLSRATGLKIEDVQNKLYSMSKKGMIKVLVKLG